MRLMLHFGRAYPGQTLTMLLALLLAGLAEGVGLTALLPMLELAVGRGAESASGSGSGRLVTTALTAVGITPSVGSLLLVILAGVVLKSVLVLLADRKVGYTVAHVATDLRLALLRTLLATRWEYYLGQPVGRLANAAATEVMRAAQAYLNGAMAVTYLVQAVVYAGVALLVSWPAALASFTVGLLLLTFLNRLVRQTRRAGARQTALLQSLLGRLTDSLQSVKPLKAMGREGLAERLLEADIVRLNQSLRKQVASKAMLKSLQEPILMLLIAGGLYIALVLSKLELPTVMVLVFLLARLLGQLGKVQRQQQEVATGESAYWALLAQIEEASRQREPASGREKPTLREQIRLQEVTFRYGPAAVLEDVSLTIPAGSFTAVVGPSGAGKTTLVDLVIGLLRPQQGAVLIDDVPLERLDLPGWRRQIGYVPQDTVLLHDTILANVTFGDPAISETQARAALRAAGALDFVAALPDGLATIVGERGGKLSGGQRQRIAIARALAHSPCLLILDEATSALDARTEAEVWRTLLGLRGQLTILAISHQSDLVQAADRVYRLEGGRIRLERSAAGERSCPVPSAPQSKTILHHAATVDTLGESGNNRRMMPTLVFVYNADSGVFNALADLAHKIFSPETYACNLCALTYANLGMRREWKAFLDGLPVGKEFLHADELRATYGIAGVPLPAIFERSREGLTLWLSAGEINGCKTLEELQRLIAGRLEAADLNEGASRKKEG